jgi:hypothetical protein
LPSFGHSSAWVDIADPPHATVRRDGGAFPAVRYDHSGGLGQHMSEKRVERRLAAVVAADVVGIRG